MSRIVDEPYFTYSAYDALTSGIQVKCPKCHGTGVVTADEDNAYFRCLSCGHQVARDRTIYRYDVHNQCKNCGRLGPFLGFLPCSPHCKPEVQEDNELNGDYDFYRPIIRLENYD